MTDQNKLKKFHDHFSLITVGEKKVPNFKWKRYQTEKIDWGKFIKNYNYTGGIKFEDGSEIPPTTNFGIVTGFEHLECVDVDLKVFSTAIEQKEFWNEYLSHLKDNILDFDDKFVIYKTKNAGYHILYRSKRVQGNLKIAALKGHVEAVIETRGVGGYIFTYPDNKVSKKSYFEIDYITDSDREIIMSFSRMYDHVEDSSDEPKKEKTEFKGGDISPWQDYNDKTDIFTIIGDDFSIPRGGNKSKFTLIKRHGSESTHSGSVFKDSGCMYLFSTGTIYDHQKLITPFIAYATKFHNKNFSEAARELYSKGYGSRVQKVIEQKEKSLPANDDLIDQYTYNKSDLVFPIEIFPKPIQSYIMECHEKLDGNIDFMGCALMWLISVCVGNSIQIKTKNGWNERGQLWIACVGRAGIGKTPSIKNIIFPIEKANNREISNYIKAREKFEFYDKLSVKDKKDYSEVEKPVKTQFIANDITLEALVDLHQESDNSVGVFKDELAGWMKDMNKYREGSDLQFWLSCWSGDSVNVNRMTRIGSFVAHPFIPVLGGIQPGILNGFSTEENKDNGFIDRLLLCYPEAKVEMYNDNEIEQDVLDWYKDKIMLFYDTIKSIIKRDPDGKIETITAVSSPEAKKEWKRVFNEYTALQNSDEENEYLKSMYPKQKGYMQRFSLLIHLFDDFFSDNTDGNSLIISKESVLKAEKLSKYFIATAKKVKITSIEVQEMKDSSFSGKTKFDKIEALYCENKDFNRSQAAEILGVSRRYIQQSVKKIEEQGVRTSANNSSQYKPRKDGVLG